MLLRNSMILVTLAGTALLSACGGGGGSSDSGSPAPTAEPVNSDTPAATSDAYDTIKGLYDTKAGDNEQYYYIGADGVFTAYNYLGDAVDAGDNCYRESTGDEANAKLNGETLEALSSGDFVLDVGGTDVTFTMDGSDVSKIEGGGINVRGTMALSFNGINIRLTTQRATAIAIDDVESMLCE
ncbi:hypothetical protein [uncultured Gilvimarinus sp.]|uniref:hypothetical protein n=1 Tax=uncultured Gilvimarinus sp. TaxID=1689143 RepID=UPI0030ED65A4